MSMAWSAIGRQFRTPQGGVGWLMGLAMAVINRRPYRLAIDALGIRPGDRVLDLGCGPGAALGALAARGAARVTGVDGSAVMVAGAAKRNRAAIGGGRIVVHHARFEALPLPDRSVDRILAVNVAYFWEDGGTVLAELHRVLDDDGLLSVYVT